MRGLIYFLISRFQIPVYCEYAVRAEKALFGQVPSVWLQNLLLADGKTGWFEELLTFFHGTHFIAFLIVGFLIWLKNKTHFNHYRTSFYILLATGISLYALVPTAPPWMASQMLGLLPKLIHFNLEIYTSYIPDITAGFNTDPVAAMPSLHAAFPFLCSLLLWKVFKWRAWPFYIYTAAIFFTIIYTADHYVIDILAGIILAILSYLLPKNFGKKGINTKQGRLTEENLKTDRKPIVVGVLIIAFSLTAGIYIKPELQRYYNDYSHLNFPDFISYPEKADSNYLIAVYLGDYFSYHGNNEIALKYYEKALKLAPTFFDRARLERKINLLNSNNH